MRGEGISTPHIHRTRWVSSKTFVCLMVAMLIALNYIWTMWVFIISVLAKTLSLMPTYPSLCNEEVRAVVVRLNYGNWRLFFYARERLSHLLTIIDSCFPKFNRS